MNRDCNAYKHSCHLPTTFLIGKILAKPYAGNKFLSLTAANSIHFALECQKRSLVLAQHVCIHDPVSLQIVSEQAAIRIVVYVKTVIQGKRVSVRLQCTL